MIATIRRYTQASCLTSGGLSVWTADQTLRILLVKSLLGINDEPHCTGYQVRPGIKAEERVPSEMIKNRPANRGLGKISDIANHVNEAGGCGGINASDIDNARPICGLPKIVRGGGNAEKGGCFMRGVRESHADHRRRRHRATADGKNRPRQPAPAGAPDEPIGKQSSRQTRKTVNEERQSAHDLGILEFDVVHLLEKA